MSTSTSTMAVLAYTFYAFMYTFYAFAYIYYAFTYAFYAFTYIIYAFTYAFYIFTYAYYALTYIYYAFTYTFYAYLRTHLYTSVFGVRTSMQKSLPYAMLLGVLFSIRVLRVLWPPPAALRAPEVSYVRNGPNLRTDKQIQSVNRGLMYSTRRIAGVIQAGSDTSSD